MPIKTQAHVPTANQTTHAHPVLGRVNTVTYLIVLHVSTKTHHHALVVIVVTPTMAPLVLGTNTVMFLIANPVPTNNQVVALHVTAASLESVQTV